MAAINVFYEFPSIYYNDECLNQSYTSKLNTGLPLSKTHSSQNKETNSNRNKVVILGHFRINLQMYVDRYCARRRFFSFMRSCTHFTVLKSFIPLLLHLSYNIMCADFMIVFVQCLQLDSTRHKISNVDFPLIYGCMCFVLYRGNSSYCCVYVLRSLRLTQPPTLCVLFSEIVLHCKFE